MKRVYTGLKAEKVDFGSYDIATATSLPPGCIQVVANEVEYVGSSVCLNPYDTTQYMYVGKDPWSQITYDASLGC